MKKKFRALGVDALESRTLMAVDLASFGPALSPTQYTFDGTGNNLAHPDWGSAGEGLLRLAPSDYGDGLSEPAGADRPSPREISNALADSQGEDLLSQGRLSAMAHAWGQFIDHDLDLTVSNEAEYFPVPAPAGDPWFDPRSTGDQVIPLTRSEFDPTTGTAEGGPREQLNRITAWLDGSMIYGSSAETSAALRSLEGGRLKTGPDDLLPLNLAEVLGAPPLAMANSGQHATSGELFAAGDVRANENIELTSLHTLWLREHNYWADRISAANPRWSDEQVFQQARSIVIAELQAITYREWLPTLLGPGALDPYRGYDPRVNPGISNEFSTAAFRFGHSLLGDEVEFLDDQGRPVADEVPLSEAFFHPQLLAEQGIDAVIKYLGSDPSSELDTQVVDSVRNFLFGPPGSGGLDLVSLNIQRGRDHGLADYNAVREALGLGRVDDFGQISSDPEVQNKLRQLYGSVDNVDLWVGVLAEDHAPGSNVGPTAQAIIADQFERLRDGDRFWYQRAFQGPMLDQLEHTRLSDVIRRHTELQNLQPNVFRFDPSLAGRVTVDGNRDGRPQPFERGAAQVTVELVSLEDHQVVATTRTDSEGRYRFDVDDGLRTGRYLVRVTSLDGQAAPPQQHAGSIDRPTQAAAPGWTSRVVAINRGDQRLAGLDLVVPARGPQPGDRLPPGSNSTGPPTTKHQPDRVGPPPTAARPALRPVGLMGSADDRDGASAAMPPRPLGKDESPGASANPPRGKAPGQQPGISPTMHQAAVDLLMARVAAPAPLPRSRGR